VELGRHPHLISLKKANMIAKDIQEERGEKGPLSPNHLRLAKERMEDNGLKSKKGMFRR
jgi:hypothetical protein